MKDKLITQIQSCMASSLNMQQLEDLRKVLTATFSNIEILKQMTSDNCKQTKA